MQWCQESLPRLIESSGISWNESRAIHLGSHDTWSYLRFPCLSGAFALWIFRERCDQKQSTEGEVEEEEEEDAKSTAGRKRGRPKGSGRGATPAKKEVRLRSAGSRQRQQASPGQCSFFLLMNCDFEESDIGKSRGTKER